MIISLQSSRYVTSLSLYGLLQGIFYLRFTKEERNHPRNTQELFQTHQRTDGTEQIKTGLTLVEVVVEAMFALFHYFFCSHLVPVHGAFFPGVHTRTRTQCGARVQGLEVVLGP